MIFLKATEYLSTKTKLSKDESLIHVIDFESNNEHRKLTNAIKEIKGAPNYSGTDHMSIAESVVAGMDKIASVIETKE